MIEITINETYRNFLKDKPYSFNKFTIVKENEKKIIDYLIERYGKIPRGKRKIYIYNIKENKTYEIGFIYSYWNEESKNKKFFQTDWITFHTVIYKPLSYKQIKKGINYHE